MSDSEAVEQPKSAGPLSGLRVLDLSRVLAGPTCTQLLGDLGADVIKVERPGVGDDTRAWGPPFVAGKNGSDTGESAYYLSSNRNKRSIALDLADPGAAALVRELSKHCDVLIENFKLGGLAKYALAYEDLVEDHPGLIYCSITGFGQTGPNAHKAGYDLLVQGFGGIMSLTGAADSEPTKVGVAIADVMGGMYASTAILAAIRHRDLSGEGQHIDLALADTQVAWLVNQGCNYLLSGEPPVRRGNQHPNIVPYQVFEVSDGHAVVAVGNDAQFRRFCQVINMSELADDERFCRNENRLHHREELVALLSERLKEIPRAELIAALEKSDIPGGPINTLPEVFASDQVAARDMKITMPYPTAANGTVDLIGNPIKYSKTPVSYRRSPPICGADTHDVIEELLGRDALDKAITGGLVS